MLLASHSDDGESAGVLRRLLPELDSIERAARALEDPRESHHHPQHILILLKALQSSIATVQYLTPRFAEPRIPDRITKDIEAGFLSHLGRLLHEGLERNGLSWPPPYPNPPPAVTRDLLEMYGRAVSPLIVLGPATRHGLDLSFHKILDQVGLLVEAWPHIESPPITVSIAADLSRPASPTRRRPSSRTASGSLVAGIALLIGLMQGPSTVNEFPSESIEFVEHVTDISQVVAVGVHDMADEVAHGLAGVIDRIH